MRGFTYLLCLMGLAITLGCSSMSARVIEQTDSTAVIEGVGPTEYEAKKNAQAKATELFVTFKETKEAECSQGYRARGRTSGTGSNKKYSASGNTYFSCVVFASKS